MSDLAPQALYELSIEIEFAGPMPNGPYNEAAPEVTPAHRAAVDAALDILRSHGFQIGNVGHGSRRTGTVGG